MTRITERCLTAFTDLLEVAAKLFGSRNPSGVVWGVVWGCLIYGASAAVFATEVISLWIALPAGFILANVKACISQLKGEPEFDDRILQALRMIEKYKANGGSEDDVRRLYYDLSVQLLKDAGMNVKSLPPHQGGPEDVAEIEVESVDPA